MTKMLFTIFIVVLPILANAKNKTIEQVFKDNKVTLEKTEMINGEPNYSVELAADPRIGSNTNKLEAEIGGNNDCKSFVMISKTDDLKISVKATMKKDGCHLSESLEPLKPSR